MTNLFPEELHTTTPSKRAGVASAGDQQARANRTGPPSLLVGQACFPSPPPQWQRPPHDYRDDCVSGSWTAGVEKRQLALRQWPQTDPCLDLRGLDAPMPSSPPITPRLGSSAAGIRRFKGLGPMERAPHLTPMALCWKRLLDGGCLAALNAPQRHSFAPCSVVACSRDVG